MKKFAKVLLSIMLAVVMGLSVFMFAACTEQPANTSEDKGGNSGEDNTPRYEFVSEDRSDYTAQKLMSNYANTTVYDFVEAYDNGGEGLGYLKGYLLGDVYNQAIDVITMMQEDAMNAQLLQAIKFQRGTDGNWYNASTASVHPVLNKLLNFALDLSEELTITEAELQLYKDTDLVYLIKYSLTNSTVYKNGKQVDVGNDTIKATIVKAIDGVLANVDYPVLRETLSAKLPDVVGILNGDFQAVLRVYGDVQLNPNAKEEAETLLESQITLNSLYSIYKMFDNGIPESMMEKSALDFLETFGVQLDQEKDAEVYAALSEVTVATVMAEYAKMQEVGYEQYFEEVMATYTEQLMTKKVVDLAKMFHAELTEEQIKEFGDMTVGELVSQLMEEFMPQPEEATDPAEQGDQPAQGEETADEQTLEELKSVILVDYTVTETDAEGQTSEVKKTVTAYDLVMAVKAAAEAFESGMATVTRPSEALYLLATAISELDPVMIDLMTYLDTLTAQTEKAEEGEVEEVVEPEQGEQPEGQTEDQPEVQPEKGLFETLAEQFAQFNNVEKYQAVKGMIGLAGSFVGYVERAALSEVITQFAKVEIPEVLVPIKGINDFIKEVLALPTWEVVTGAEKLGDEAAKTLENVTLNEYLSLLGNVLKGFENTPVADFVEKYGKMTVAQMEAYDKDELKADFEKVVAFGKTMLKQMINSYNFGNEKVQAFVAALTAMTDEQLSDDTLVKELTKNFTLGDVAQSLMKIGNDAYTNVKEVLDKYMSGNHGEGQDTDYMSVEGKTFDYNVLQLDNYDGEPDEETMGTLSEQYDSSTIAFENGEFTWEFASGKNIQGTFEQKVNIVTLEGAYVGDEQIKFSGTLTVSEFGEVLFYAGEVQTTEGMTSVYATYFEHYEAPKPVDVAGNTFVYQSDSYSHLSDEECDQLIATYSKTYLTFTKEGTVAFMGSEGTIWEGTYVQDGDVIQVTAFINEVKVEIEMNVFGDAVDYLVYQDGEKEFTASYYLAQ